MMRQITRWKLPTTGARNQHEVKDPDVMNKIGVFSQLERNMTVSRIKSGLSNAKAKGARLGRPALTINDIPKKVVDNFGNYLDKIISKTDYAKICGVSRPKLDKYIAIMTDK